MVHQRGITLFQDLNNWLGKSPRRDTCHVHCLLLLERFLYLGLLVNEEKSDLIPSKRFVFMGVLYDLITCRVYPTEQNVDKVLLSIRTFNTASSLST